MKLISRILKAGLLAALAACSFSLDISNTPTPVPPTATQSMIVLPAATQSPSTPTTLPWAAQGLTGRLLFILYTQESKELVALDLESGEQAVVFHPHDDAWLTAFDLSPNLSTLVLAYSPPPEEGEYQLGYSGIYVLPVGSAAEPVEVLAATPGQSSYFFPVWSPDGRYIYYSHFIIQDGQSKYLLERIAFPGGQPELLIEDAYWPRLARDGSVMAYLTIDYNTFNSELYLADLDANNRRPAYAPDLFLTVDAPLVSPDGQTVLFSAPSLDVPSSPLNWLERLLGVRVARAHSLPADWWQVPVSGGEPQRLTEVYAQIIYGDYSPDGNHIVTLSSFGLFLTDKDGGNVTFIEVHGVPGGAVNWVP